MIDLTSGNLDETIDYDDYQDYIYIGARNIFKKYTNTSNGEKQMEEVTEIFNIVKCDESNYETVFEKKYYEHNKDLIAYCLDN